ncbi:MAG: DUF2460 domain-containing protein [Nitratireductor sp.]|nr:DUF2460 domain-containing protein [Nitratireductor sp.]
MPQLAAFHDVLFPTDIALGSTGGPERLTEIVTLGSGREQRNARWAHSRRRYNAGYGVRTLADLQTVIAFFEERRGRLHGFRFRDPLDNRSAAPGMAISPLDQGIGTGDGAMADFQLVKTYGAGATAYQRAIVKPVEDTVVVAVDGIVKVEGLDFSADASTGVIHFLAGREPGAGEEVRAGFDFHVPVRFDADEISVNIKTFLAGDIASIPIVEIIP